MAADPFPSGDSLSASEISKLGRHGYVFGTKMAGSWAPFIHDIVFRGLGLPWGQVRLEGDDVKEFEKLTHHPDFFGAAVTMPNKVSILPYLDEVTDECQDIGACNTLYIGQERQHRVLCGANTDAIGIRDAFYQNIKNSEQTFHNHPALVIGGGGAARSAVYALKKLMKVKSIYIVNRDAAEVDAILEDCSKRGYGDNLFYVKAVSQASTLEAPGAIISCIPDVKPKTETEVELWKIVEAFLNKDLKGVVLDMCYNPTPFTRLVALSEQKGWSVILGTEALIWQALEQDRLWTGKRVDEKLAQRVREGVAQKIAEKRGN